MDLNPHEWFLLQNKLPSKLVENYLVLPLSWRGEGTEIFVSNSSST